MGAESKTDYLLLADEFEALPANTAIRLTPRSQAIIVDALRLVEKVDICMAVLGAHGEISARDDRADDVMRLLHRIDPK